MNIWKSKMETVEKHRAPQELSITEVNRELEKRKDWINWQNEEKPSRWKTENKTKNYILKYQ